MVITIPLRLTGRNLSLREMFNTPAPYPNTESVVLIFSLFNTKRSTERSEPASQGGCGGPPEIVKNLHYKCCNLSLHCAMPQSGNFAIQAKSLFQSSLNLHFLFGASRLFTGGSAITYPENVENSARNHPDRLRKTMGLCARRFNDLIWEPLVRVEVEP